MEMTVFFDRMVSLKTTLNRITSFFIIHQNKERTPRLFDTYVYFLIITINNKKIVLNLNSKETNNI